MFSKLICIVGATGNQGGCVARRFLADPSYRALAAAGAEIVYADLDDIESVAAAFSIFSVANYWEPFFRPDCRQRTAEASISCRKYAYRVELQQGKNIADAAARTVTAPDAPVPHLEVNADMGTSTPKNYMVEGTTCSWSEYMRLWSQATGAPGRYQQITLDELIENVSDKEFGRELGDMFLYSTSPGYDGADGTLIKAADIRRGCCTYVLTKFKLGVDCPTTSLQDRMEKGDWSALLSK
ncbi:hypothetical protein C8Q76DRAFT_770441 [Earliella scabrosa]|nr:hypothetical protein C8Q76DRAFT_770441 [Earliella scabrosa]